MAENASIIQSKFSTLVIQAIKNVRLLEVFGGKSMEIRENIEGIAIQNGSIGIKSNGTKTIILNVNSSMEFYYEKMNLVITDNENLVINELSDLRMEIILENQFLNIEEYEIKSSPTNLTINLKNNTPLTMKSSNLEGNIFKNILINGGNNTLISGQFENLLILRSDIVEISGKFGETVLKDVKHLKLKNYFGNVCNL